MLTSTVERTVYATATRTLTSLPLFLPTVVPISSDLPTLSAGVELPGISASAGIGVGGIAYKHINFLGSVVAADAQAVTYELDCQTVGANILAGRESSFTCPYSGAMVTSGPSTYAFLQPTPYFSMSCASMADDVPQGCTTSGALPTNTAPFSDALLVITAGSEKLSSATMTAAPAMTGSPTSDASSSTLGPITTAASSHAAPSLKPATTSGPATGAAPKTQWHPYYTLLMTFACLAAVAVG